MDPVRLGRALGAGARAAAKTAVAAVDAATTPNPTTPPSQTRPSRPVAQQRTVSTPARSTAPSQIAPKKTTAGSAANAAAKTATGLKQGARHFGREVWNPFVRLSGVLWLEVTGVFFGLFALFGLGAAWRLRWAWKSTTNNLPEHQRLLGAVAMCAVFGYFCISSFVRAKRRERGR